MHVISTQPAVEHFHLRAAGIDKAARMMRRGKAERTHEATQQRQARRNRERLQYRARNRSDASGGGVYVLRSLLLPKHLEAS